MSDDTGLIVAAALLDLSSAVYNLATAVAVLAAVGLIGYWVALRRARS